MINSSLLKLVLITLPVLLSLFSRTDEKCLKATNTTSIDKEFKTISIKEITNSQNAETLIKSYYYLPLETNENCIIGHIDKIMFHNKRIYILDENQAKSIFVYGLDGTFINKICKIGKGPGEYDKIQDIEIDSSLNQIIVLCTNLRKLIFYDALSGRFIREEHLEVGPLSFVKTDGENYLFDARLELGKKAGENRLMVVDSSFNYITGYFLRSNFTSTENTPFTRYNDIIYYCANYNDTVFAFRNGALSGRYYIDFGSRKLDMATLPRELFSDKGVLKKKIVPFLDQHKFAQYVRESKIPFHIMSFFESDDFIRFSFVYEGKVANAIYDKSSQSVKTYLTLRQKNDICFDGMIYAVKGNSFVGVVNANMLEQVIESRKKNNSMYLDDIRKKVHLPENFSAYDNPMLIFVNYLNF